MKLILPGSLLLIFSFVVPFKSYSAQKAIFWDFQSIDTMKYSRDLSREKLTDPSFNQVINQQVKNIASTGATHVAVATPYDEEFLPILKQWIQAARNYQLKVWFRGNWSGWEKWFDYFPIDRTIHLKKTEKFILENRALFEDGDIFTACPECENGGPGDPRRNGDLEGYRRFLISEYQITKEAFKKIGKNVKSNYNSMNGDVAFLVMDKKTTAALDGVVVIDHYVVSPDRLVIDIEKLAKQSGGKIVLGEFGAPIEGIHGQMAEEEQAAWISSALTKLVSIPEILGVNYWVNVGGETQLWNDRGESRKAVEVLKNFYNPLQIRGTVSNELGDPIINVLVQGSERTITTDKKGFFNLPSLKESQTLKVSASDYRNQEVKISHQAATANIILEKTHEDLLFRLKKFLLKFFRRL